MNCSQAEAREQLLAGMSSTRPCEPLSGSSGDMNMTEVTPAPDLLQISHSRHSSTDCSNREHKCRGKH